jgi:hypothetical protein
MPSISASNQQWLLKSLDTNKNQIMDELVVEPALKARLDSNQDGQLSQTEVLQALGQDQIEIKNGAIGSLQAQPLLIEGKQTLETVHQQVHRTLSSPHVVAPRAADVIDVVGSLLIEDKRSYSEKQADRRRYLELSNISYLSAVSSMRSTLQNVVDMTANATDSRSQSIHASAKASLSSSMSWGTGVAVTGWLIGVSGLESVNSGLQVAYSNLKGSLNAIKNKSENLPEPDKTLKASDQKIAQAFNQMQTLEKKQSSNDATLNSLSDQAQAMELKVTGRAGNYALVGTGLGVVAGATAGYFLGGANLKGALIGAGVGAGGSAGLGALIGKGIDSSYQSKAEVLKKQMASIQSFKPDQARSQLQNLNQTLYRLGSQTQGPLDLDRAQGLDNDLKGLETQADKVIGELNQVQKAYQDGKKP